MDKNQSLSDLSIAKTSRLLALTFVALYGIGLLMSFSAAMVLGSDEWFSTFKDAFFVLGGILGTIVGYYFGSSRTQEAEKNLLESENKLSEMTDKLKAAERRAANLRNELLGTGLGENTGPVVLDDQESLDGPTYDNSTLELPNGDNQPADDESGN